MISDIFYDLNINLKSIQLLGLNGAAYMSVLLTIYSKATNKGKLIDNDYFKVDRKYISNTIGLLQEEQLICDLNLIKLGIMKKHAEDPDIVKIDVNLYLSLISSDDIKLIENVRKEMNIKKPKGIKQSQRQATINALKESIVCSNYELLTALRGWVDSIYANPNGFLSKSAITTFQDTLNNYTKGDLDLALRIVQIASIQGYKDCSWAINVYEKDAKMKNKSNFRNNISVRVTEQEAASDADMSEVVF